MSMASKRLGNAKELVERKIAERKVMVFAKPSCSFCVMAKKVLDQYRGKELNNKNYEIVQVTSLKEPDKIMAYLHIKTGARTVPRVFINGQCIGGGTETVTMHKNGQLMKELAKPFEP